jgi:hypothetical protein
MAEECDPASLVRELTLFAREARRRYGVVVSEVQENSPTFLGNIYPNGIKLLEGIDTTEEEPLRRILNACVHSGKFQEENNPVENPVENPAEIPLTAAENNAVDMLAAFYNQDSLSREIVRSLILTRSHDFKVEGIYFKIRVINMLPHLLMHDPVGQGAEFEARRQQYVETSSVLTEYYQNKAKSKKSGTLVRSQIQANKLKESKLMHAKVYCPISIV